MRGFRQARTTATSYTLTSKRFGGDRVKCGGTPLKVPPSKQAECRLA
jgi:hypothetical protein